MSSTPQFTFIDSRWVDGDDAVVSMHDLGVLRGIAVFDWLRIVEGAPLHLDDHLARLEASATALGLHLPLAPAAIADTLVEGISRNGVRHGGVRILVTGGDSDDSITPNGTARLALLYAFRDGPPDPIAPPCTLAVVPTPRAFPEIKTTSYIGAFLALQSLRGTSFDDALLVDRRADPSLVLEATRANFFGVSGGTIVTAATGVLPGVTRKRVLDLARAAGLAVEERDVQEAELASFSEAFVTRSDLGIVPVSAIGARRFDRPAGPVVGQVARLYAEDVEEHVARFVSSRSARRGTVMADG